MSKAIDEQIQELTDFGEISGKYLQYWKIAMCNIQAETRAHEHGESPTIGKGYIELQNEFIANQDEYMKIAPFVEIANKSALAQLIIENNRQLIALIKMLVEDRKCSYEEFI